MKEKIQKLLKKLNKSEKVHSRSLSYPNKEKLGIYTGVACFLLFVGYALFVAIFGCCLDLDWNTITNIWFVLVAFSFLTCMWLFSNILKGVYDVTEVVNNKNLVTYHYKYDKKTPVMIFESLDEADSRIPEYIKEREKLDEEKQ